MFKTTRKPEEILSLVLDQIKTSFGQELEAVVLYGSAAGPEFKPGLSDLNLLVVVKPKGLERLAALAAYQDNWRQKRVAAPLVVTQEEIDRSLDSFPLEFLDMKLRHRTIFGPDPLVDIDIDPAHLRLQCERARPATLCVRRARARPAGGREEDLRHTALASLKAFAAVFRGVLHLLGQETGRLSAPQVLAEGARQLGLADAAVLEELWRLRETPKPPRGRVRQLLGRYLTVITKAAAKIDRWTPQGG